MNSAEIEVEIKVAANGSVELCTRTPTADSGWTKHYDCFYPGQDVSGQSEEIQAACALAHTPEVIAAWDRKRADDEAKVPVPGQ